MESKGTGKATFIYDDCCPLCKGYTSVFSALGWADRQGFSTIDRATLEDLDLDRARHQIPLHDADSGAVRYGLDGILDVVQQRARPLARIARLKPIRAALDAIYWLITYNRRHIVASPPPDVGIDCAPDFNRNAVMTYVILAAGITVLLTALSGTVVVMTAVTVFVACFMALRKPVHEIAPWQAIGHGSSVVLAAAGLAAAAEAVTNAVLWASLVLVATAGRKLWLRRWMLGL